MDTEDAFARCKGQLEAFLQEYAHRIATSLKQQIHEQAGVEDPSEIQTLRSPTKKELMDLYSHLLDEYQDLDPKLRDVLRQKSLASSRFATSLADRIQMIESKPPQNQNLCLCGEEHPVDPANGHDPEHAFDVEPYIDEDIDDGDISDEDTDDEDEDDEDYNDDDEEEDYENDDDLVMEAGFLGNEALDALRDINSATFDAELKSQSSQVEERARGPPTRRPEEGQSRLMAAIANDPTLFDRYRFAKGANSSADVSRGKGKSVQRDSDAPTGHGADTEPRPQQKIGVMALLEELGVSVTRGERPTEEMTKSFMQNLANNLEKLEGKYTKDKGLTADQWKRIDEIHSTLMRERRMQQKPDRLRSIVASDQLRIEEERRQRELSEKKRIHRLEEERKRRQAAEADQAARSKLFEYAAASKVDLVKRMVEGQSNADSPMQHSSKAVNLEGWEYLDFAEDEQDVDVGQGMCESLLHIACRVHNFELVSFLTDKGAPLDALDSEGRLPLHTAAEQTAPLEICKLLVEKSAAHLIDRPALSTGKTALHYAAHVGHPDMVALLIQNHARITGVDSDGNTPEQLAKAGLKRKRSKIRTEDYRRALAYIQKAAAAIKEAQRQRDLALEEQRQREAELAREEAEKDEAMRRKQEEKLEASRRRREQEEAELARLKAQAADPHGQNNSGAGGGKKKKKKKGKGPEEEKTTIPATGVAVAAPSAPSNAPSTKTRSQTAPVLSKSNNEPPKQSSAAPPTELPVASTTKTSTSRVPEPERTPVTTYSPSVDIERPPVTRLPKLKTSYRPTQLVVDRLVDMGFPGRESRKALIQSEGRFENAIELLTNNAPLADDSEDEAEAAATKARLKQESKAVSRHASIAKDSPRSSASAVNSGSSKQQPQASKTAKNAVASQLAGKTSTTQASATTTVGMQRTPSSGSTSNLPKLDVPRRQLSLAPEFVPSGTVPLHPTHSMQRTVSSGSLSSGSVRPLTLAPEFVPSASTPRGAPSSIVSVSAESTDAPRRILTRVREFVPAGAVSLPTSQSAAAIAVSKSKSPFLEPLTIPPAPTRARFTYGQRRPTGSSDGNAAAVNENKSDNPSSELVMIDEGITRNSSRTTVDESIASDNSIWDHLQDRDAGVASSGLFNTLGFIDIPVPSEFHNGIWDSSSQASADSSKSNEPALLVDLTQLSTEFRPTAIMGEMLRQSEAELGEASDDDGEVLDDVLALVAAIKPDELVEASVGSTRSRAAAFGPIVTPQIQDKSGLWGYDSPVHGISPIGKPWPSSSTAEEQERDGSGANTQAYSQWGTGFDLKESMYPSVARRFSGIERASFLEDLMGSIESDFGISPGQYNPMATTLSDFNMDHFSTPAMTGQSSETGSRRGLASGRPLQSTLPLQPPSLMRSSEEISAQPWSSVPRKDSVSEASFVPLGIDPLRQSQRSEQQGVVGSGTGQEPGSAGVRKLNHALEFARYPQLSPQLSFQSQQQQPPQTPSTSSVDGTTSATDRSSRSGG
ncbi:uncharacterized protein EMPS_10114 [Entomortierella parvispora]|uniref:UBA domain-containing protein n=1 Tax=Entomortierella parvispora TaxID=205924 RepID=A0A9P3M187_9FUNG|nr:uncharacterized protein EMPS_10114 [Entomortierella parvispora]